MKQENNVDWNRLQRYLSADTYQKVQDTLPNKRSDICLLPLNNLLRSIVTYLPRHLALELLQKPMIARNKGEFLKGTLLFADISGFTSLSETLLNEKGMEGTDAIVNIINTYLEAMLEILYQHQGILINFGGDSMLCLFTGENHGAIAAMQVAWDMQRVMAIRFAEVIAFQKRFPLSMKVGLNSGEIFAANIGTARHMEYVLVGAVVESTALAESVANPKDIIVGQQTRMLLANAVKSQELKNHPGFHQILEICTQTEEVAKSESQGIKLKQVAPAHIQKNISIPPDLYIRLLRTLPSCGPFSSDSDLRSIFIDARINVWRNEIPHAETPAERVRKTIAFLYEQFNTKEQNALILFLCVLRDQVSSNNACYSALSELIKSFENAVSSDLLMEVSQPNEMSTEAQFENLWSDIESELDRLKNNLWEVLERLDALSPYLPSGILSYLVNDPLQGQVEDQHRLVTVLFSNFWGMSKFIQFRRNNTEAIFSTLAKYFTEIQGIIDTYGGMINKIDVYTQGNKLMVLFGAPIAYPDDAYRAGVSASEMQLAMRKLSPMITRFLSQKISLNTGLVFAGTVGAAKYNRREYTVMGDAVNLAARLISKANSGETFLSQSIWDQLKVNFKAKKLPALSIRGKCDPVPAFLLETTDNFHKYVNQPSFHTPLVGRASELRQLQNYSDNLQNRKLKNIVSISGDAGIGKSRLIQEWQRIVDTSTTSATWVFGYARSFGAKSCGIFIEIVEQLLGFSDGGFSESRWHKVSVYVEKLLPSLDEEQFDKYLATMAYLGYFLSLDFSKMEELLEQIEQLDTQTRQVQIRLAVCALIEYFALQTPLILVLEDLHWADKASLDMLEFVSSRLKHNTPILFCLTHRKEIVTTPEHSIWHRFIPSANEIMLNGLDSSLLQSLLRVNKISRTFSRLIIGATGGNPLFVEEVLHVLHEDNVLVYQQGTGWQISLAIPNIQIPITLPQTIQSHMDTLDAKSPGVRRVLETVSAVDEEYLEDLLFNYIRIPTTLHQIVQSRVDALDTKNPGVRRVLWMASVVGEDCPEDLLLHLFTSQGGREEKFWEHIEALGQACMLREIDMGSEEQPRWGYHFWHRLLHKITYEGMVVAERRKYHVEVAQWLEQAYSKDLQRHYPMLANHYDKGHQWDKAIHYHWLAGKQDASIYANESAQSHLQRALDIIKQLPSSDVLWEVQLELGKVLVHQGQLDDAISTLQSAYDLLTHITKPEVTPHKAELCFHIGRTYELKGGPENRSKALAWQSKGLEFLPDSSIMQAALLYALGGLVKYRQGDFKTAIQDAEHALELAKTVDAKQALGQIYRLLSMIHRALGQRETALEYCKYGIEISSEISDLLGLIKGYSNQGVIAFELDEWQLAYNSYHHALSDLELVGDQFELARVAANLADLDYHLGEVDEGISLAERALSTFIKLTSHQGITITRVILASLFWRKGALDAAMEQLLEAQELVRDDIFFQPMVSRWMAQVYLTNGDITDAEAEIQPWLSDEKQDILEDEYEPIYRLWGQILAACGEFEESQSVLETSLERLKQDKKQYQLACTSLALAEVLAKIQKSEEARLYAAGARAIFIGLGAKSDLEMTEKFFLTS